MNNLIDELGTINQQIKELEAIARNLKDALIAKGIGNYEGEQFTAQVQEYDRAAINVGLVRELADPEFISAVTEIKHIQAVVVKPI